MKNDNYTYKEIMSQAETWKEVYEDIVSGRISLNLSFLSDKYDEIMFFGCGSSYNLSLAASFFTKTLMKGQSCSALPSSELLINPDVYISKNKKYLLIGFSRSGETVETIDVLKRLKERYKNNIVSFTLSCIRENKISNFSDYNFVCRNAVEKSIVMTVSFSSMLLAYCLILLKYAGNRKMLNELWSFINYMDSNISNIFNDIESYMEANDFDIYFVLGSGFNYGLAVEADLKMKEMSQTSSYSYHLYEFNHGPKSLVDKNTLCLILALNKSFYKIENVINAILALNGKVLLIGNKDAFKINNGGMSYFMFGSEFESGLITSFLSIPIFQILAYLKTIKKKLDPDRPKNLSYTTRI